VLEHVATKLLGYVLGLLPASVLSTLCFSCSRISHWRSCGTVAGCDFDGCSLSSVTFASLQDWLRSLHLAPRINGITICQKDIARDQTGPCRVC
jgi:hypothetical protein